MAALEEVFPQVRHQRCWFHRIGNILNVMPKSQHGKVKAALGEIWNAATRADAIVAFNQFVDTNAARYPKAVEKLVKDRDALLAFYDFPAEHWQHCGPRIRLNRRSRRCAIVRAARVTVCLVRRSLAWRSSWIEAAERSWKKIRGADKIDPLMKGIPFKDGTPVIESTPAPQALAA